MRGHKAISTLTLVASETFGPWLRLKMQRAGLNQSELALELGLAGSVVNRWLRGQAKPSAASCKVIADYFEMPLDEVYRLVGIPFTQEAATRSRSFDERLVSLLADRPVAIPIHDQMASAGTGQQVLEYAYWEPPRAAGRNIVGLRVHGDSMAPDILDGDTIFFDRDKSAEPGNTVVATVGDEVVVKKLRKRGSRLFLVGATGEIEASDAKIEGVVLSLQRDIP